MSIWTFLKRPQPDGHKFFLKRGDNTRYYLADDSGVRPDETDDGPLYVDVDRKIVERKLSDGSMSYSVPVLDEAGNMSHTVAEVNEAHWLCQELGMVIEVVPDESEESPTTDVHQQILAELKRLNEQIAELVDVAWRMYNQVPPGA